MCEAMPRIDPDVRRHVVLSLWRQGWDTAAIARRHFLPEVCVARIVSDEIDAFAWVRSRQRQTEAGHAR